MSAPYKPGWSAAEVLALPVALRIDLLIRCKPCPQCKRYIDNRNHRRHAKACMRKARTSG